MSTSHPVYSTPIPLTKDGATLVAIAVLFVALATAITALRFYSRRLRGLRAGADDYTILAALIMYYTYGVSLLLGVFVGGLDHHVTDLQPYQLVNALKIVLYLQVVYGVTLGLIKCGICLLLIRIFFTRSFRIAAKVVMGFSIAWTLMVILIALLICTPIELQWSLDPAATGGHCGNQNAAYAAVGAYDILVDLMILILPMPMVWKLQVPVANKIALLMFFGLGVFTMVIGALRVAFIFETNFLDATYSARNVFLWSVIEPGIGILVASGPVLRPALEKVFKIKPLSTMLTKNSQKSSGKSEPSKADGFSRLSDTQSNIPLKTVYGSHSEVVTNYRDHAMRQESYMEEGHSHSNSSTPLPAAARSEAPPEGISVQNEWSVLRH